MRSATETWKRLALMGLGATVLTAEKVKELAEHLVAEGDLSQEEAKQFVEELKAKALREKDNFEQRIHEAVDTQVKKAIHAIGLVTRAEFDELKAKLNEQGNTN